MSIKRIQPLKEDFTMADLRSKINEIIKRLNRDANYPEPVEVSIRRIADQVNSLAR